MGLFLPCLKANQNDGLPLLKLGLLLLTGSGSPSTANLDFKNQVLRPCAVRILPKARVCVGPTRGMPRSACHTFHPLSLGKLASLKKKRGGPWKHHSRPRQDPRGLPAPRGHSASRRQGLTGVPPAAGFPRAAHSQPAWTTQIRVLQRSTRYVTGHRRTKEGGKNFASPKA